MGMSEEEAEIMRRFSDMDRGVCPECTRLRAERNALRDLLDRAMRRVGHTAGCRESFSPFCQCGLDELRKDYEKLKEARSDGHSGD